MVRKLSYEDFLKSFEFAPRLTVELVVENSNGEILLLKRESDPYKNHWHLPGGFLLKDEKIAACITRIARDELNMKNSSNYKKLDVFETVKGDPRGHIIHYVVKLKTEKVEDGEFFKTLPSDTIPYQKKFLLELGYK